MENSTYYNAKSINFIKILHRIVVSFVVLLVILIFALRLNDTVSFKDGQIFSDSPQLKVTAPDEVRILSVTVKEGQQVKKGDTLFVLENKKTRSDFEILNTDIASMQNKIVIYENLIANTIERKKSLSQLLKIQSRIYKTDRSKTIMEIQALNNRLNLTTQQTSILNDKFKTDSLLYAKGAISRYEMASTKNQKLNDKKDEFEIGSEHSVKNYDFANLRNNYSRTKNDLRRNIIDVDNQIQGFQRDIVEMQMKIKENESTLAYISDELQKLIIVSPNDGTISNLFNARQSIQLVNKGDLLAIIAPKKESFYAKVILNERDLAYVQTGQEINLKLDAYNYYRYGAIKGNITYVSPSDVDKTFYCLANIRQYNSNINLKAGYQLKGEVIIERMQLFQYIIKKLFNKIDNSIT